MRRIIKVIVVLISLVAFTSFIASCGKGTNQPTSTSPTASLPPSTLPTTSPTGGESTSVTFDFDTGSPVLSLRQNTPFDQTSGGVIAHFSSPSDPATFSIQNHDTTFFNLGEFSGNYLFDNTPTRNILNITFNRPVTGITLTFATIDYHDPGAGGQPSSLQLTAYNTSGGTTPIGSVSAFGTFTNDSYPQGTLSFSSPNQPFDSVAIEIPFLAQGATDFLVDNIIAAVAP